MLDRQNSVVLLGAYLDACALWRLYMPHFNLPGSSFYIFKQKPDFSLFTGHDVCVVQRCCTPGQFEFLKMAAGLKMKIVYDLDDNVWEIPHYNPAHQTLSMHREGFTACIRLVDVVSVSTRELAKAVKKHVKQLTHLHTGKEIPIIVAENRIEERLFTIPTRREDKIVIGWAGSSSHVGDLKLVEPALAAIANEFPEQVLVQFRGCEPLPQSPLYGIPNFEHKLWTPVAEFGARMPRWGWHIGLAPVINNSFNDSKSCIKMVESAYCKTPCLASWVRPYDEFCSHDKELRWLLCVDSFGWEKKLRELVNDAARREDLGERMHKVMREHYSFNRPHDGWRAVFDAANYKPPTQNSQELAPGIVLS